MDLSIIFKHFKKYLVGENKLEKFGEIFRLFINPFQTNEEKKGNMRHFKISFTFLCMHKTKRRK